MKLDFISILPDNQNPRRAPSVAVFSCRGETSLDEIEQSGAAIPAYFANPYTFHNKTEHEFLLGLFENGRVRILSVKPSSGREIMQYERLFTELDRFSPAVLLPCSVLDAPSELCAIARKTPGTVYIITGADARSYPALSDLMWRQKNICSDTAGFDFAFGLETALREFGADRFFFSLAQKGCGSMSALALSNLSNEEKRSVACNNILKYASSKYIPERTAPEIRNSYWERLMSGDLSEADLICADAYIGTAGDTLCPGFDGETLSMLTKIRERFGFMSVIVSGADARDNFCIAGNRRAEALAKPVGGYRGWFVYDPAGGALRPDMIYDFFHRGFFAGFAPAGENNPLDDAYAPCYEYASRHRMPVLLKKSNGLRPNANDMSVLFEKYPAVAFITDFEITGGDNVFTLTDMPELPERAIFGGGFCLRDPAYALGNLFSCGLCDEQIETAARGNIETILKRKI